MGLGNRVFSDLDFDLAVCTDLPWSLDSEPSAPPFPRGENSPRTFTSLSAEEAPIVPSVAAGPSPSIFT